MSLTKADLVDKISAAKLTSTRTIAADIVNIMFELMEETLGRGESLKLSGFGSFVVVEKHPRIGRNPQTGEPMEITGRRIVKFKASPVLKSEVNELDVLPRQRMPRTRPDWEDVFTK